MLKNSSILVTGGTGFIGSAIVRRLVSEGNKVRVLDNDSRGHKTRLDDIHNKLEFITADIRDSEAVISATEGMDCVLHLAFINGTEFFYKEPDLVLDVGVRGIVNILDVIILISYILDFDNLDYQELVIADVNGDSILDVLDVVNLVNLILN